jgi:hypothetical protein
MHFVRRREDRDGSLERLAPGKPGEGLPQSHQALVDPIGCNGTGMDGADPMGPALEETDLTLPHLKAHPDPFGLRTDHFRRRQIAQFADPLHLVEEDLLFDPKLLGVVDVLQLAAAAVPDIPAEGHGPVAGGFHDAVQSREDVVPFPGDRLNLHHLAGQHIRHKMNHAVDSGHPEPPVGHADNGRPNHRSSPRGLRAVTAMPCPAVAISSSSSPRPAKRLRITPRTAPGTTNE